MVHLTQLFYNNEKFFDFVDKCRKAGINVPIIPGIKPIEKLRHIMFMPKFFHIDFPEALAKELLKCKTDQEVFDLGVEWGIEQTKELYKANVPGIHFYTMGKSSSVKKIAKEVF